MDQFDLRKYVSDKTLLEDQPKKAPMKNKRRIHEAKSSIHKKLSEIENLGRSAALEIKMEALVKEIDSRNGRLSMIDENEDLAELMNPQKIREMKKEIKMLEKQQAKYQKLLEKEKGKDLPKKEVEDEVIDEDEAVNERNWKKNPMGSPPGRDADDDIGPSDDDRDYYPLSEEGEEDGIEEGGNLDSDSETKSFLRKQPDHKW